MQTVLEAKQANIQWLLDADEPWTHYRTFVDLLDKPEVDPDEIRDIFAGIGLTGDFWDPRANTFS